MRFMRSAGAPWVGLRRREVSTTVSERWKGIGFALVAAGLFGASTPLAKSLLPEIGPVLLAGLLYLASGLGLGVYWLVVRAGGRVRSAEAALGRRDVWWMALVVGFGGVAGPVLLMWGLARTAASSAALLLNVEGVLTALLAWFVFRENFDRRVALGMALITAGGVCLSWAGRPEGGVPWGAVAVAGACLAWAIDNNLTRKLSASDPVQIAMVKGLAAGAVNTVLALSLGASVPGGVAVVAASVVGVLGYGVSLVLFILALRHVGTARTGAYFSTAPFIGAAVAVMLLGDKVGAGLVMAAGLMGAGVWLHLTERHEHEHRHDAAEHEHSHLHDAHHQHAHAAGDHSGEPHSHPHRHDGLVHSHPHYPDVHHRHAH
jgi:drug/metabolite transporter (DMT)-like permease